MSSKNNKNVENDMNFDIIKNFFDYINDFIKTDSFKEENEKHVEKNISDYFFKKLNKLKNKMTSDNNVKNYNNVICDDDKILLKILAPGIKKNDLNLIVEDSNISVNVNDNVDSLIDINFDFTIPDGYDIDNITSKLEDGILFIIIPKKELKSRKINID